MADPYPSQFEYRMGPRRKIGGYVTLIYPDRDGNQQSQECRALDLSANALSVRVPRDHPVFDQFHRLFTNRVQLSHPVLPDRTSRGVPAFLCRVDRMSRDQSRWVFFFSRKISLPSR